MACLRRDLQGIDVEEALAVQRHAAENAIVKGPLHHIRIPGIRPDLQHPPGKKYQADRRAGLRVSRIIGQIIGIGKSLSHMCPAHPSGNIHFFVYNIIPERLTGTVQAFIPCKLRHIGHAGIQIHCAHRMSHGLLLLPHRQMRLMILIAQFLLPALFHGFRMLSVKVTGLLPSLVHEKTAQFQILSLSCGPVQPRQRHLRDLMARIAPAFSFLFSEMRRNIIRKTPCRLQKFILARGLIISHCALRQVSETIQLVVIPKIGKGFVPAHMPGPGKPEGGRVGAFKLLDGPPPSAP